MCKTKVIKTIKTHLLTSTFWNPCEASSGLHVICISMLSFSKYGEQHILGWNLYKKNYERQILPIITHQSRIHNIIMCPCIKF